MFQYYAAFWGLGFLHDQERVFDRDDSAERFITDDEDSPGGRGMISEDINLVTSRIGYYIEEHYVIVTKALNDLSQTMWLV